MLLNSGERRCSTKHSPSFALMSSFIHLSDSVTALCTQNHLSAKFTSPYLPGTQSKSYKISLFSAQCFVIILFLKRCFKQTSFHSKFRMKQDETGENKHSKVFEVLLKLHFGKNFSLLLSADTGKASNFAIHHPL